MNLFLFRVSLLAILIDIALVFQYSLMDIPMINDYSLKLFCNQYNYKFLLDFYPFIVEGWLIYNYFKLSVYQNNRFFIHYQKTGGLNDLIFLMFCSMLTDIVVISFARYSFESLLIFQVYCSGLFLTTLQFILVYKILRNIKQGCKKFT